MKRTWRLAAGLAWVGLLAAACARQTPTPTSAPPTAVVEAPAQRGLALVDSLEVRPPAGGTVAVVARGPLADACTRLDEATVERQAQVFVVTLFTWREAGPACPPAGQGYEHTQALAVAGLPAGDYLVVVNGVSASLALGPAPTASGAASPTPAAEATRPAQATGESPTAQPSPLPPTATPATAASPTAAATAGGAAEPGNCVDKAAFYGDVTVPDDTEFKQGEQFVKTWKVRNEGTCSWRGYSLVFAGDEAMSGPLNSPLPETPPETLVDIAITLVSPTRGGSHLGNWEFQDAHGRRFGVGASGKGPVWVRISVGYSAQEEVVPPPDTVGSSPPPASPNPCGATRNASREADVLSRINAARAQQGLGTLSEQAQLSAAAAQHSQDMACFDFISHTGTDGTSWKHRVAGQGYANYNSAREIIYAGDVAFGADPAGAFGWWMASQVHHDIILFPGVSEVGVASATHPGRPNQAYYTVVFARPAPAAPRTRGQAHR